MDAKLLCPFCPGAYFSTKFTLMRHQTKFHPPGSTVERVEPKRKGCCVEGCSFRFKSKNELRFHLAGFHCLRLEKFIMAFSSLEEMKAWKDAMEEETSSKYVKLKSYTAANGTVKLFLHCRPSRRTPQGAEGSVGVCPAGIEASVEESGGVRVVYWPVHYGHDSPQEAADPGGGTLDPEVIVETVEESDDTLPTNGCAVACQGEEPMEEDESSVVVSEVVVTTADQGAPGTDNIECQSKWDDEATLLLILKRAEMDADFRSRPKKRHLWERAAIWLTKVTGVGYSGIQCRSKWENLLATYRNNKAREGKSLTWPYFKAMDNFLGTSFSTVGKATPPEDEVPHNVKKGLEQLLLDPVDHKISEVLFLASDPSSPGKTSSPKVKTPKIDLPPNSQATKGCTAVFVEGPTPMLRLSLPKRSVDSDSRQDAEGSKLQLPRQLLTPKSTKSLTLWIPQDVKLQPPSDPVLGNTPPQQGKPARGRGSKPQLKTTLDSASTIEPTQGSLTSVPEIFESFSLEEAATDPVQDTAQSSPQELSRASEMEHTEDFSPRLRKRLRLVNRRRESVVSSVESIMAKHYRALKAMERRQEKHHRETLSVLRQIADALRRLKKPGPSD